MPYYTLFFKKFGPIKSPIFGPKTTWRPAIVATQSEWQIFIEAIMANEHDYCYSRGWYWKVW